MTCAVSQRVTVTGELLFRRLEDLREIVSVTAPHPKIAGVETLRLAPGNLTPTLANVVSGVKWNAGSTVVVTGQTVWRIGNGGLTAAFTPTVGVAYLF